MIRLIYRLLIFLSFSFAFLPAYPSNVLEQIDELVKETSKKKKSKHCDSIEYYHINSHILTNVPDFVDTYLITADETLKTINVRGGALKVYKHTGEGFMITMAEGPIGMEFLGIDFDVDVTIGALNTVSNIFSMQFGRNFDKHRDVKALHQTPYEAVTVLSRIYADLNKWKPTRGKGLTTMGISPEKRSNYLKERADFLKSRNTSMLVATYPYSFKGDPRTATVEVIYDARDKKNKSVKIECIGETKDEPLVTYFGITVWSLGGILDPEDMRFQKVIARCTVGRKDKKVILLGDRTETPDSDIEDLVFDK